VGDPERPGHEQRDTLHLHRWCQWISRHHRGGVYDGEEGKRADFVRTLPPYLLEEVLLPHLRTGGEAVVLAEEWHTADAVLHLDWLLRRAGVRERACVLWNANNVFGFDRIDWPQLDLASVITTVSRYMKHCMWEHGVDPIVIPNGLSPDAFRPPEAAAVRSFERRLEGRTVLAKVARGLFQGADAVLANSGREPFGLVGIETMAVGGVACTGCSGEDYAVPGRNALVLQTANPLEFVGLFRRLRADPGEERAIRRAGPRVYRSSSA
jgi:glycosyltransferase involved in cell wall biosynthesis